MASSSSAPLQWQPPLTPFEMIRKDHPYAVERLAKVYDLRHYILLSFAAAYGAKRLSGRPLKGIVAGGAAMISFIALDRLSTSPEMANLLKESRKEVWAKEKELKLEEKALKKQLNDAGKKLGKRVADDGRCLFYAAGADADEALKLIQEDETVRKAFLEILEDNHDVFKETKRPKSDEAVVELYCEKMGGEKKNYPFAQNEMLPVIAQLLKSKLLVYRGGFSMETSPPKNGYGEQVVEIALLGNHYWPVASK